MSGEQLRQAYEALRAQATGQSPAPAAPRGLALFLRSGLGGWMQAWRRLITTSLPPRREPETAPDRTGLSAELALVLIQMALNAQPADLLTLPT